MIAFLFLCSLLASSTLSQLTQSQKVAILDIHNQLRNKIASGSVSAAFPAASNMVELIWDDNLEKLAQNYANKKVFSHNPNRKVPQLPGYIGENLYTSSSWGSQKQTFNAKSAVQSWYDEIKDFKYKTLTFGNFRGKAVGHFTQVIWAETQRIGCGLKTYPGNNRWTTNLFV